MRSKPILYLDMDDVLVDFNSSKRIPPEDKKIYNHPRMYEWGFFFELEPMPGAVEFIQQLEKEDNFEIHVLTQPVATNPISYTEKAAWIAKYFPSLIFNLHMSQHKHFFKGSILVDDNLKWKHFEGEFFHFQPRQGSEEWLRLKQYLSKFLET